MAEKSRQPLLSSNTVSIWNAWIEDNPLVPKWPDLQGVSFQCEELVGVKIPEGQLQRSSFMDCNMRKASLCRAECGGANFQGSSLERASFEGADLMGADFSNSDLSGANFFQANLSDVTLTGANLTFANFTQAINLGCYQLVVGLNWESAFRDNELQCGGQLPRYATTFDEYLELIDASSAEVLEKSAAVREIVSLVVSEIRNDFPRLGHNRPPAEYVVKEEDLSAISSIGSELDKAEEAASSKNEKKVSRATKKLSDYLAIVEKKVAEGIGMIIWKALQDGISELISALLRLAKGLL